MASIRILARPLKSLQIKCNFKNLFIKKTVLHHIDSLKKKEQPYIHKTILFNMYYIKPFIN